MSLPAFAIRVSAIRMLRGATLAGANVFDSPLDPVPQALSATTPLIHVYTESEALRTGNEQRAIGNERNLLQGDRRVNLTLQIFLPVDEKVSAPAGPLPIATRRGGGQAIIDVIYRQVEAALVANQGGWHDLYRRLVDGYHSVESRPYVIQTEKGVRLAAREVELSCDAQSSPAFGPMAPLWSDFVDAMRADPDLKALADLVEKQITGDVTLTQAEIDASLLGLSAYEAAAIGLGAAPPEDLNNDPQDSDVAIDEVPAAPDAPAPDGYPVSP